MSDGTCANFLIKKNVAVSGATGFLGAALVTQLLETGRYVVHALVRRDDIKFPVGVRAVCVRSDYLERGDVPLAGIDIFVHCAARVHVMADVSVDPLAEYRKVNVDGTLRLAEQAAKAGVKRFIFISTIKVNGDSTPFGKPFTADDLPVPSDPYGISKMEAEKKLIALGDETGMEVVIIRPVLIYGPGVKANFRSLLGWLNKGIPLPLGAINNRRSLVALDNVVDLIITCLDHPAARNQIFLVSDGDDMSTTELLRRMGIALRRTPRLIPVPEKWLICIAELLGRRDMAQRLCESLQVDIGKNRELLSWEPPVTVANAMRNTAQDFQEHLA